MKKPIQIKSDLYELRFPDITVEKAAEIDYGSYSRGQYNSFTEMQKLLCSIDFELYQNEVKIFDSRESDIEREDFQLCVQIYQAIKSELFLDKMEFANFSKECVDFLNNSDSKAKMPYELLLAHNVVNNNATMALSDIEKMNIKKYEKLITAISILQKHQEGKNGA